MSRGEAVQRLVHSLEQAKEKCRLWGDTQDHQVMYNILLQFDMLPREACTAFREMSYDEILRLPSGQKDTVLEKIRETFDHLRTS